MKLTHLLRHTSVRICIPTAGCLTGTKTQYKVTVQGRVAAASACRFGRPVDKEGYVPSSITGEKTKKNREVLKKKANAIIH